MHIQTINYTRTFNLGNYSSEKIGVEFALNQGESATKALDVARDLVEEYHKQNVTRLKYLNEFYQEVPDEIIPTQSKKTLAEKTAEFINLCKTRRGNHSCRSSDRASPGSYRGNLARFCRTRCG